MGSTALGCSNCAALGAMNIHSHQSSLTRCSWGCALTGRPLGADKGANTSTRARAHVAASPQTHVHACTHPHIHTRSHTHMHTCTHAHMHTFTHAHIHTCSHAHTHTCTHPHMLACTHAPATGSDVASGVLLPPLSPSLNLLATSLPSPSASTPPSSGPTSSDRDRCFLHTHASKSHVTPFHSDNYRQ
jgi:hypothetical protein